MSLILKNNIVFPIFKHQETLTYQNRQKSTHITQRVDTSSPINRLASPQNRTIHLSPQREQILKISPRNKQNSFITPKPIRNEENHSLQCYLNHLNSMSALKSPRKAIPQSTDNRMILQRGKSIKEQTNKKKKISLLETVHNPNAYQYKKFTEQLYNLIHNLHQLKDYLNNQRKLFQVVKNLIGIKKNLYRILIKPQTEELHDFSEISRLCCIKDVQFVNGEQRVIEKFDLSLMDDLIYMSESIKQLLLQNQLKAINRMSDNIRVEQTEISKLKGQLGIREQNHSLSIESLAMKKFQPHLELKCIEQKLGQLNYIPKQVRETSELLCDIVDKLNG
ncbi:unnamed protein product [Paramecium pentaurelia]|uniref:Uncharacterized protein n=1 Tax=Paramecium pentaurelia TaxID=43138 RepID=A0A8S1VED0_9CILI|nr:unnamed protein product [Paramecium pentaurelia]